MLVAMQKIRHQAGGSDSSVGSGDDVESLLCFDLHRGPYTHASMHCRTRQQLSLGPGRPLDTEKFFIICTNVLGGCYGSTGPSSIDPATGERYATRFPILTISDMVRAQFRLVDHFGIKRLHASVGASMGGMQVCDKFRATCA